MSTGGSASAGRGSGVGGGGADGGGLGEVNDLVKRVHETGDALIVVQDGEPAAALIDASEFAALREHRRFLDAVQAGLTDVEAGRVLTTR